jgi:hypothetical protein
MRPALAILLLLTLATGALAQDGAAPVGTVTVTIQTKVEVVETVTPVGKGDSASPFDDDSIRAVVKCDGRLTKRVILVIDVSGSMKSENRIGRAIQVVKHVMGQPVDDLEVAVVTFSSKWERWPGIPEPEADPPVPYGWARLPSAKALENAQHWVATRDSGGTEPDDALRTAIKESRDDVSVVFITDGDFSGDSCVAAFREGQQARKDSGRAEAPVLVYGVGSGAENQEHLATIGKEGGCGFWVDKAPAAQTSEQPWKRRRYR